MNTCSEYRRIIWLHNRFKNQSFNIDEYFHTFGVKQRTFQRDIWKLRNYFNAPLICKNSKYFYNDETFELPAFLLNEKELFGLLITSAVVSQYKGTPMYNSLNKILEKLSSMLATDISYFYMDVSKGNKNIRDFNWDVLEKIIRAIYKKNFIKIKYHSFNQNKIADRILEPYHVYNYKGEFYMVAYCPKNKAFRDFFVGRVKNIEVLNKKYKQRNFCTDKYFSDKQWGIIKGGKLIDVSFKVKKHIEPWILEKYGDIVKKKSETRQWSYFNMKIKITDEFINWVFGYGKDFMILKPDSLKYKMKKKCREIEQVYEE